ncbi:hypothetical protein FA10DRAFT_138862 [Acaromyces ingoldii]|uniref:Uncharacterized protein n=1 Tax=Acaromyces ingoldii TaxID=215250 RepID=A0A316YJI4_9BASI|nr:hypothetical protein FA10DRAFT_138862 [Acaromyces ingoldii]PWN89236.1 hypothetical protein FA10DRAFT_138862 [Acaromyces ingoldii]
MNGDDQIAAGKNGGQSSGKPQDGDREGSMRAFPRAPTCLRPALTSARVDQERSRGGESQQMAAFKYLFRRAVVGVRVRAKEERLKTTRAGHRTVERTETPKSGRERRNKRVKRGRKGGEREGGTEKRRRTTTNREKERNCVDDDEQRACPGRSVRRV